MRLSGVITIDRCDIHAKGKVQRSMVNAKRSEQILHKFGNFRTASPVWIRRWLRDDAHSTNIFNLDSNGEFPDPNSSLNSPMVMFWCTKLDVACVLNYLDSDGADFEVWEWIKFFIPKFTACVITYLCWDYSLPMLIKKAPGNKTGNTHTSKEMNFLWQARLPLD